MNNFLNPSKVNFYDATRDDFIEVKSAPEVLEELSITEQGYENALKISISVAFDGPLIHALSIITLI